MPLAAALFLASMSFAGGLARGEYVTDGGWGQLDLTSGAGGQLAFSIRSAGANGHSCRLDGLLPPSKSSAALEGETADSPCLVSFKRTPKGIDVGSEGCRGYCGLRAGFDGIYMRPPSACSPSAVVLSRASFQRFYRAKNYEKARGELEPLLGSCSKFVLLSELDRICNDLAVTYHLQGDDARCLAVLRPLRKFAAQSDAEILKSLSYAPSDAQAAVAAARTIRNTVRLCSAR